MGKKLEEIVGFNELTGKIKGITESPTFRLLKTSLSKVAGDYYHSVDGNEAKELVLNESRARELADKLWEVAATHIAVNYLKLKEAQIQELKEMKDPASGKSQWETFIREHLGIDKDGIYESLKTRGVVKPEEIDTLVRPIYEQHANVIATKMVTPAIDTMEKAQAALRYLGDLKKAHPQAYEGVNIPTTFKSVDEAQRLYVSLARALPPDSKPNVPYKKAA